MSERRRHDYEASRLILYQTLLPPPAWEYVRERLPEIELSRSTIDRRRAMARKRKQKLGRDTGNQVIFNLAEGTAIHQLLLNLGIDHAPKVCRPIARDTLNFMALDPAEQHPMMALEDAARDYALEQHRRAFAGRNPVEWITHRMALAAFAM